MGQCCGKGAKEDAGASPDAGRCNNCDRSGCPNCDKKGGEKRASGGSGGKG